MTMCFTPGPDQQDAIPRFCPGDALDVAVGVDEVDDFFWAHAAQFDFVRSGHGLGCLRGFERGHALQEQIGPFELHFRGDAPCYPVVDALNTAGLLVVPEQGSELGGSAQRFDDFSVGAHDVLNTVFTANVNTAFINKSFSSPTIVGMHASMQRLLNFVKENTVSADVKADPLTEIKRRLGATSAVMTNWKSRGISQRGALDAQAVFGCSATWVVDGTGSPLAPIAAPAPTVGAAPPGAKVDFTSRTVSESQWDMLQDIAICPAEEQAALAALLKVRANAARQEEQAQLKRVKAASKQNPAKQFVRPQDQQAPAAPGSKGKVQR